MRGAKSTVMPTLSKQKICNELDQSKRGCNDIIDL